MGMAVSGPVNLSSSNRNRNMPDLMEMEMTPEAARILGVFREHGIRAGGWHHFTEFGDAIVWEEGRVRDQNVRTALKFLFDEGSLIELNAGLELTARGEREAYGNILAPFHGARIFRVGGKLIVKQTELRGTPAEYVVDQQRERHVDEDDDTSIAAAVRDALSGCL